MNTLWRKAFRDFWQERARTALVVLAIALGISAFSAVLSSYAILTRELDNGYLATNPASAVLRVDSADDDLVKAIFDKPSPMLMRNFDQCVAERKALEPELRAFLKVK